MKNPAPAVILAASTNGLGAVRSLYSAGIPVIVVVASHEEPALLSRLPVQKVIAGPKDEDLLRALHGLAGPRPVLIPTSDRYVAFMSQHRQQLADSFDFCLPADELAALLIDKASETELIEKLGIPLPLTVRDLPPTAVELAGLLGFPVIVKPRSFAYLATLGKKNVVLGNLAELTLFYEEHLPILPFLLAQQVIPGGDENLWVCNCSIGRSHEVLAAFTFRRLRTAPSHYGVTSYAVSEDNAVVKEQVRRLVAGLRYLGPAMVEFKYDPRDGLYKYIELNPRLGLVNFFDTSCGVNNVLNAYLVASGAAMPSADHRQRDGVMYLCLFEDVYARYKDGEKLFAILGHYLRNALRLHVGAYWVWHDPWPAVAVGYRNVMRVLIAISRKFQVSGAWRGRRNVVVAPEPKQAQL